MAASVNNSGSIFCQSTNDLYSLSAQFITLGGFSAWATNIVNPGTVDVGVGGTMIFNGQNVDLDNGTCIMESGQPGTSGTSASGFGSFGTNYWDPGFLGPTTAESGSPVPPHSDPRSWSSRIQPHIFSRRIFQMEAAIT